MKHTILIHGAPEEQEYFDPSFPSPSNSGWFPWLQKQLSLQKGLCQAPEFPRAYDPVYAEWARIFERLEITKETTLVGHSCGGGFLLRFLSEHPDMAPARVFLIAPWLDPNKTLTTDFFGFTIDPTLTDRTHVELFISSDDEDSMWDSFRTIKIALPLITVHEFSDKEHFTQKEFPELLEKLT